MMDLSLEQLFYGRGERGYGILGASAGAKPYVARVKALCGAVGTPSGEYHGEPFLLSVPEDDSVLMLCGRRGVPDSMGRSTLFFHALIAEKRSLSAASTDAFSLFSQGFFSGNLPSDEIAPLSIQTIPGNDASMLRPDSRTVDVALPCVFRSVKPIFDLVRVGVGERVNDLAWATFAFQPMSGFNVQVLPPRVSVSLSFNEYDTSGKLLRPAKTGRDGSSIRPPSGGSPPLPTNHSSAFNNTYSPAGDGKTKSSAMLKISLAANFVLAAVCVILFASRKSSPQPSSPNEKTIVVTNVFTKVEENPNPRLAIPESIDAIKGEDVATYKERLVASILEKDRIGVFTNEVLIIPGILDYAAADAKVKRFVEKLSVYVSFVNTNFFNTTPKEKTTP